MILSVVFPAISGVYERSPASAADLFRMGSRYVTFLLLPLAAGVVLFAREGLGFWLGAEFAENALAVTQVLAIGSFVNCLALSPFSFLQAVGRPDITAKLHLIELPIYVVLIWQLTTRLGLIGVGLAWSLRMALDLGLLLYVTSRQWAAMQPVTRATGALFVTASAILLPLILVRSPVWKLATLTAISAASAWFLWVEWRVRRAGPGEQGA